MVLQAVATCARTGVCALMGWVGTSAFFACGSSQAPFPTARPARSDVGPLPWGPPAPSATSLPIPSLDAVWSPPQVVAGDVHAFADALKRELVVVLVSGPRFTGTAWSERTSNMLRELAQAIRVETFTPSPLSSLLETKGPLPLEREPSMAVDSGPRYRKDAIQLDNADVARLFEHSKATTLLALDDAELELASWRALETRTVGSCKPALAVLAQGQEQSLALLEPALDHVDRTLWQIYRSSLHAFLPGLEEELAAYAKLKTRTLFEDDASWQQYQCGHAYWEYLQNYTRCATPQSCPSAPRVFLIGGARIGSAEPSVLLGEQCPTLVGKDYVRELRQIAKESMQVASDRLDRVWMELADRAGTLTSVHASLEDVCTPRRRRYAEEDLRVLRARLAAIVDALRSHEPPRNHAKWLFQDHLFHVPGMGPVRQVARWDAGKASVSDRVTRDADDLRELAFDRARCRSGFSDTPLVVLMAKNTGAVEFLGFFYEEELLCPGLPPF